jgi:hypothetical protein
MRRFLIAAGTPVLVIREGDEWRDKASWKEHTTQHDHEFCNDDLVADPQNPDHYKLPKGAARWTARNYAVAGYTLFKRDGWTMVVTPEYMTIEQGEGVNRKVFRGQHAK